MNIDWMNFTPWSALLGGILIGLSAGGLILFNGRIAGISGILAAFRLKQAGVPFVIVEKNADAVTCAGKIHTDLARGFIKAEIVSHEELMTAHNFKDAGAKGLTKLVDADFPIPEKMVLDIRFNV